MNTNKRTNILFINDGSLDNPIILSQGLPLLKSISGSKFNPYFVSFEPRENSAEVLNKLSGIRKQYEGKVTFVTTQLKYKRFLPNWLIFFFEGILSVSKLIKNEKIKILHARSLFPATIGWVTKLRFPDVKLLYDNRGVFIDEMIEKNKWKKNGLKEKFFRQFENLLERYCDWIVVVSNHFKTHLLSKHKNNISSKISVISNRTLIDMNIDLTQKYSNKIILVYSGSSAIWQNSSELKRLFIQALNIFDEVMFKIISYEQDKFQSLFSAESELSHRINIVSVEPAKVKEELSKCNCGILLRKNNLINNVSSPLKFAEYLAAGLPVLLSESIGDTESIIQKYNVGVIIKDNDYVTALEELRELLNDKDLYHRCLRTANKEFNLNNSFNQYQEIYDRL